MKQYPPTKSQMSLKDMKTDDFNNYLAWKNVALSVFVRALEDSVGKFGPSDYKRGLHELFKAQAIQFVLVDFWDSIWNDLLEWEQDYWLPAIRRYHENGELLPNLQEFYAGLPSDLPAGPEDEDEVYSGREVQEDECRGED